MLVNPDKSTAVISLKGSAAKRWLRARCQRVGTRTLVNFGSPLSSLWIPRASHMVYLGIIASYGNYEAQTLKHRLQAGAQNRQRLAKLLHSNVLSLRYRVRLYQACIRSTIVYGLHAVGMTDSVLQKLDSWDARALRALAKSPSHLTHESNVNLRSRLDILSPEAFLIRLVQRRLEKVRDPACIIQFQSQLALLHARTTTLSTGSSARLFSMSQVQQVPCDICGCYFPGRRIMLSHHARQHKEAPSLITHKDTLHAQYTLHTVDGMPTCKHCNTTFNRVDGLKKALARSVPGLARGWLCTGFGQ